VVLRQEIHRVNAPAQPVGGREDMVRRVYSHLGTVRHRSELVDFRVDQQRDLLLRSRPKPATAHQALGKHERAIGLRIGAPFACWPCPRGRPAFRRRLLARPPPRARLGHQPPRDGNIPLVTSSSAIPASDATVNVEEPGIP
jgi:hypothetical protein